MTGRRRALAVGFALAFSAVSARAEEPRRPIVQAVAASPDACLDGPSVAASIATWLNKQEIDARISIMVRRPSESLVRFTVEKGEKLVGERDLPVGTLPCADLRAALTLAIAIAIDSTLLESLGIEPPVTEPTPRDPDVRVTPPPWPPEPEPVRALPPAKRAPPLEGAPHGLGLALEAIALFGVLPGAALGAVPRLGFSPSESFEVRASALGTTRAQAAIGAGTASAAILAGQLEACLMGPADEVRGALCAGGAYGSFNAEASGLEPSYSPGLPWAAVTARVEARYPAKTKLAAVAAVSAYLPVLRPELEVIDREGRVRDSWQPPVAGFGVSLGADLYIW